MPENVFLPLFFLLNLFFFQGEIFPVFFQPPLLVLFLLLLRISLGQKGQQDRAGQHRHISREGRRASHNHRASHPHDQRNAVFAEGHRRTVNVNSCISESKPPSRVTTEQILCFSPFFRKNIAHHAVGVIHKSRFFRRNSDSMVSVVDGEKTAAHNDPEAENIDHVPKIQLHALHPEAVYIDAIRGIQIVNGPFCSIIMKHCVPAGNHRSGVNDIVVFVPPNQKIPGKGHIIVADKAGFVHFFCIQHKHGVSVPYEEQFLTVERKSFFKRIFHGSIPRRVFPYGKPFSIFRLKMDRNIFQPSIGKGKRALGRIRQEEILHLSCLGQQRRL